ncbi:MAG: ABC transporter ATP-binding protein [Bacteroidales bacterium]|nr:ABC transporter ATP-binding protein [Bacteroidales bacterium]MDD2424730.1 ABC transporter ATP-binding protein [Bacteroidales bacterium]MDD3989297.1 ABC transporter ATP-binding protein [Bacteroidales bacterium]
MEYLLELESLVIGYKKQIYPEISSKVRKGEVVALIGPNGIGKSTLLRTICAILKPRKGAVVVMGKNTSDYREGELALNVSYVPSQSPRTKALSLFDMVSAGCYNRSDWLGRVSSRERKQIISTLGKVGLSELAHRDSSELSDGEFQRAAIARSLVQDSPLILMDEPTAFLDIENKIIISRLLREIADGGKSIIFSTHDLLYASRICTRIWIMGYQGFIEGTPEELKEKGAFENIFKDSSVTAEDKLFSFI